MDWPLQFVPFVPELLRTNNGDGDGDKALTCDGSDQIVQCPVMIDRVIIRDRL